MKGNRKKKAMYSPRNVFCRSISIAKSLSRLLNRPSTSSRDDWGLLINFFTLSIISQNNVPRLINNYFQVKSLKKNSFFNGWSLVLVLLYLLYRHNTAHRIERTWDQVCFPTRAQRHFVFFFLTLVVEFLAFALGPLGKRLQPVDWENDYLVLLKLLRVTDLAYLNTYLSRSVGVKLAWNFVTKLLSFLEA